MPGEAGQNAIDERHHPLTATRPILEVNGGRWARRDHFVESGCCEDLDIQHRIEELLVISWSKGIGPNNRTFRLDLIYS